MQKKLLLLLIVAGISKYAFPQQPQFNLQISEKIQHFGPGYGFTQDQQGYIWFSSFTKGLIKYDGKTFKTFRHEPENPNSPSSNLIISMAVDQSGKIWIANYGSGLDRFDPVTNSFTHFRNNKADNNSLISDTVFSVMIDHTGKLWIGTIKGLENFDFKTNKFTHIPKKINDKPTDVSPAVFELYEDKKGIIWFSTNDPITGTSDSGGLLQLDPSTGKQIFYKADPLNPESLMNPGVTAIFEDKRGNLWVGTKGNGLHTLDRKTGKFTRYLYDPSQPGKLGRPPIGKNDTTDIISFIREDHAGKLWIGSLENGLNWYDPKTQQLYHFGLVKGNKNNPAFAKDTLTGFKDEGAIRFMIAADSSTWITTQSGNIYTVSYGRKTIPYFTNKNAVNSFYLEPDGNTLWFGTDSGLVRKDLAANSFKIWVHDPKNPGSLNNNNVVAIKADEKGKLYIGAHTGGLDLFDPLTGTFTHIKPANATPGKIMDSLHSIFIENDRYLWLGGENGLARVDRTTNNFDVWRFNKEDDKGISGTTVYSIAKDKKNNNWFANVGGLDKFISDSNSFRHYLKGYSVRAVLVDAKGTLWAGTDVGLYQYDETKDLFVQFNSPVFSMGIETILNILEDDQHTLWVTTANGILKISANRERIQMFNADYGILSSNWNWLNNYKANDGRLFIGGGSGYYMFKPEEINVSNPAPLLNFSQLIIGSKEIFPGDDGILSAPIWNTEKINLSYNQNSFSLDFVAVNYNSSEAIKYLYQLENFGNAWNNLGTDHKASFFNVPPGHYKLRVRAMNSEGTITEKTLSIIISPPWWKTWWAYSVYALLIIIAGWQVYLYQKRHIVSKERERNREKELEHAKEIEKAYKTLQATQAQLVQSEKMASLGELTAGIAHEIQNPLNFVNNFSEVNTELIDELTEEANKGNLDEVKAIAKDIRENEQKINHHGKRADAIVKGMLQHSRSSSGQKEPVNINALADEYLRLAYHGLRAKDKSFNATLKTDFDETIGNINIIPQDIGRVILNLITNAFYVVDEKKKQQSAGGGYEPTVSVSTKKEGNKVLISVKDNGNGIPPKVLDKIFQPFFTTKPTGQGTGLGLSLSYDIIKAHGGELKAQTKEGEFAEFVITLPV
ncbi:two-component regulator propeller domain-containing protein [Ferruginibacter sp. SUN106]|uniref:sensor histidine kinase n=1 Tax=Ferruginibacter sp. SUN106 TaxID=2978348 RepID=UPI003D369C38